MRKKERYEKILAWFRENVPVASIIRILQRLSNLR